MNLPALAKECARRFTDIVGSLQKQAPSAKMAGKFAVDQAVREARKVVARPSSKDDAPSD